MPRRRPRGVVKGVAGMYGRDDPFGRRSGRSQMEEMFDQFFGRGSMFPGYGTERPARQSVDLTSYLSEHAKELIQRSAEIAVERGKSDVDTEHLLAALIDSDVVQAVLKQHKVSDDEIRRYLDANSPRGDVVDEAQAEVGVTPRVKDALRAAFMVSPADMGHSYIGPEHMLVGLATEPDGMAGDLLREYTLTPEALRQSIVSVVGRGAEEGRVEPPSTTPELDKHGRDLTALARQGQLDPVIGRADEIQTTIEVLACRRKNNPVLIGEAGVGKTAIVEGLAQRIVNHEVPEVLRDKRVVELNLNSLVAGSKYRGEFEERIKNVVDEIVEHKDELVVFIDEIHTIAGAGAGGEEGGLDAANVMKPALARGELHLIGATTLNEYQKYIEKDAALERRFQPVFVDEPTVIQAIEILRGLRDTYEAHHKVRISDEAVVAAAELSDRYITNRFLPDKAIDLLDQAAARIRIRSKSRPPDLQELEATIGTRRREMDYLSSRKRFDEAQALKDEIEELEGRLEVGTDEWRTEVGTGSTEVTAEDVAEIVSSLTGIPVAELTAEEREKLVGMEQRLHERVIGQEEAVRAVSDAVRRSRAGLTEGARPIATLLFLGPTGVGKTELARALAWTVFGDEDAMIRIDMSEYMERHTVSRLVGAPPGYVGYDEGGQLTERVRRRPYAVVLLDEIEKAHPDVHNVLLQVFDDGRLTDGKGRTVDFTNTVIIATSNVGADLIQENLRQASQGGGLGYEELKEQVSERLRSHFRPEFLNRIDEIVLFHALDREQIRQIVELTLTRLERTARGQGVDLVWDESLLEHLAEAGYQPEYGARELQRLVRNEVESELAREILGGAIQPGDEVRVGYDPANDSVTFEVEDRIEVDLEEASSEPATID